MSLVRRRRTIQSNTFAKKRRKKMIFVGVLFFVATLSILVSVFFFFREGFVQIQSVEVSGPIGVNGGELSIVPAEALKADVKADLSGSFLYLFSKNTLFFYPKNAIRAELLNKYPAIASIDFDSQGSFLGFGKDIVLRLLVTERTPFAEACSSEPDQSCYFMDDSGFIYTPAAQFSPGVYVDYQSSPPQPASSSILSPESPSVSPGQFISDPATFSDAKNIVNSIVAMGLHVTTDIMGSDVFGPTNTIVINDGSSAGFSVASSTTFASTTSKILTTEIYFNQNEPIDKELRYFSEFWREQATTTDVVYQYVDMRYGKDIVYKVYEPLKDESVKK